VVGHEAVSVADGVAVGKGFFQNLEKQHPVPVAEEDGLTGVAPGGEVVERSGEFDAKGAGHENRLPEKDLK
jgi:hypothetical protein